MKKKILTVSSANMDFVMDMPYIPKAGETVLCGGKCKYVPGGKGANSAVAFSRLGGESIFCTRLGNDQNGDALLSVYNNEKIDTEFIVRDEVLSTGLAAIMVDADGNNRIAVFPGANMAISENQISEALKKSPDALYMQLEISKDAVIYAAKEASKKKIPIFIDAGPADPNFPFNELPALEIFSPNESETEILTGIYPDSKEKCSLAAKKLADLVTARYYVIKLGARGCYVSDLKNAFFVPSFKVRAVDSTAAGDSFTAALVLRYLESGNIRDAAKYANAVGALVVGRPGALPSIPTKEEAEKFISENKTVLSEI
jgi:ribokinase